MSIRLRVLSESYPMNANAVDHWGVGVSPRTDESYKVLTFMLLVAKLPILNDAKYLETY